MNLADLYHEYEKLCVEVDGEFRRVFQLFAERMQCRKGCSMCCSQPFTISLIEAAYIARAMKQMDEATRARLRARARQYLETRSDLIEKRQRQLSEESELPITTGLRLTCPALENDACQIYHARPLICRKWGIPLFNPKKPHELQACELNFRPGEEVDVEGLVEPQAKLLEDWVTLKDAALRAFNPPARRVTVAEAIVNDYEAVLTGQEPERETTP